jgi:hypothetical protein
VVKEIRLYVEGGGDKEGKARLRQAFTTFLGELHNEARRRGVRWQTVLCGSRTQTYEDFRLALRTHPNALNLLLVDAERAVTESVPDHLQAAAPEGDGWKLSSIKEDQMHLMAQLMEAWFVAEPTVLSALYGKGFTANALPRTKNVEAIEKATVMDGLHRATKDTQKGAYHKMRHSPLILERLNADTVAGRAPHCARLLQKLRDELGISK